MIVTALLASSSSLFATNIIHTGLDASRALSIEIKADGSVRTVKAGVGELLVDGTDLIDVFCVNLFTTININQTYTANSIDAGVYDFDGSQAAWLMATYLPVINAAPVADRRVEGAALQLAIWDMIHDGGDGFKSGRIQSSLNTNSSVLALANQWRLEALDETGTAKVYTAAAGTRVFQQQMYLTSEGGEVPEPGTFAMLLIGGLGVGFGAWRRNRQTVN